MAIDLEKKVRIILATVLDIEENKVEDFERGISTEWDSMAWVNIIGALEDEFEIELQDTDYEKVSSYKMICNLIRDKYIANG